MHVSRHTPIAGVRKPLMANCQRVHSICARQSPRALRNKGSDLRSSADESGCLLPGNMWRRRTISLTPITVASNTKTPHGATVEVADVSNAGTASDQEHGPDCGPRARRFRGGRNDDDRETNGGGRSRVVRFSGSERSESCLFWSVMYFDVLCAAAPRRPGRTRVTTRGLTPLPARKRVS